ncbi:MAG TPA: hypothetical protein PKI19_03515 [Elusimicrobiales bacterium]|nr:hypothetical protein [Elusimicrobiales bacterium]
MKHKTRIFTAALLLSALTLPLHAQTALEQVSFLAPGIEFSAPQPALKNAEEPGLTPEQARAKLALFNYQKSDVLAVKRGAPSVHKSYSLEKIELRLNDPLRQIGEYTQRYQYYRTAQPGPRPTVLVFSPFSGAKTIDAWAALHFAKKGYNAVVIVPAQSLADKTRPLDQTDDLLIRETISARICIDLLETFPEVDSSKIYATGISMGGIRTTLAFGVEPRIKKAAEVVGGGDLPGVIADTHFSLLRKTRDARMKIEGIATLAEFRTYMKKVMTVDPMDFGSLRNPEDLMVMMGRGDTYVRDAYQKKLYNAFSRPLEGRFPVLKTTGQGHIITAVNATTHVELLKQFFER